MTPDTLNGHDDPCRHPVGEPCGDTCTGRADQTPAALAPDATPPDERRGEPDVARQGGGGGGSGNWGVGQLLVAALVGFAFSQLGTQLIMGSEIVRRVDLTAAIERERREQDRWLADHKERLSRTSDAVDRLAGEVQALTRQVVTLAAALERHPWDQRK